MSAEKAVKWLPRVIRIGNSEPSLNRVERDLRRCMAPISFVEEKPVHWVGGAELSPFCSLLTSSYTLTRTYTEFHKNFYWLSSLPLYRFGAACFFVHTQMVCFCAFREHISNSATFILMALGGSENVIRFIMRTAVFSYHFLWLHSAVALRRLEFCPLEFLLGEFSCSLTENSCAYLATISRINALSSYFLRVICHRFHDIWACYKREHSWKQKGARDTEEKRSA